MTLFSRISNFFDSNKAKAVGGSSETMRSITSQDLAGSDIEAAIIAAMFGGTGVTEIPINLASALSLSPFYAGVKKLATIVSVLPFQLYRRDKDNVETPAYDHPLYNLVHSEPNEIQNNVTFAQAEKLNEACHGRSMVKINFSRGTPVSLDLLSPSNVKITKINRKLFFKHVNHDEGIEEILEHWRVIHLFNVSFDGINGLNPIQTLAPSLKRGINSQAYGNNYFANGTHSGATLESDKTPPDGKNEQFTDSVLKYWNRRNAGVSKAGQPVVLWDGMKYNKTGDSLAESMLLGVLQMTTQDVSRILDIPAELLDTSNKSEATKHEQLMLQLRMSILPYLKMREAEYNRKLIPKSEKGRLFFKHNIKGLMKIDTEAQARLFETLFKVQAYSPDDILDKLDEPPRKDGKGGEYGLPFASNIKTDAKKPIEKKSFIKT